MACPSCGGQLSLPADLDRVTCAYCATQLVVDAGEGYTALRIAEQVATAIRDSGATTASALRETSEATKVELHRLQLNQQISSLQVQLSATQGEIRSLQRSQRTRTIRSQLAQLRSQEATIARQIDTVRRQLPPEAKLAQPSLSAGPTKQSEWSNARGCLAAFLIYVAPATLLAAFGISADEISQSAFLSFLNVVFFAVALAGFLYFRKRSHTFRSLLRRASNIRRPTERATYDGEAASINDTTDSA